MLFPPQRDERIRQPAPLRPQPVNDGVASRAEGDQPGGDVPPGPAVMNRALMGRPAALAAVAVSHEDGFPAPAEAPARVGDLLVTSAAQPGDGGVGPATAEQARLRGFQQGSV